MADVDRFRGCLLGLALGDALGRSGEGSRGIAGWRPPSAEAAPVLEWTDDTEMAIGLAESLVERRGLDPDHLAKRWADRYSPWRGYGGGARALLGMIREGKDWREANRAVFPDGSFGNGAAMRAAPLGLFFHDDPEALLREARAAAAITHAHPLGIDGGVLLAVAAARALAAPADAFALVEALDGVCATDEFRRRLATVRKWRQASIDLEAVRADLGNGVAAHRSAVTAVYVFCRCPDDFLGLAAYANALGGDTDTIAAMAGALFGARHGTAALPADLVARLEARAEIDALALALHAARPARR